MICHVVFLLRDFVWWQFCSNLLVFRIMSCGIVTLLSSCQASDLNFESDLVGFFVSCFVSIVFLLSSIYFFSWFVFPLIPTAGSFGSSRRIVYPGCNAMLTVCVLPKINEKLNTKSKWHKTCFTVWARRCTYQEDSVPISGMISRLGENTLEIHFFLSSFAFEQKIDYPQSGFSASEHVY